MKKIYIAIIAASIMLTGCSNDTANKTEQPAKQVTQEVQSADKEDKSTKLSEAEQKAMMDKYNKLIQGNVSEKEVIKYISDNIKDISKENAAKLVLGLETVQKKNVEKRIDSFFQGDIEQRIIKAFDYGKLTKETIEKTEDTELKQILMDTVDSGYKFICPEGSYYPIIDYDMTYKKFGKYATPEVREYLEIQAMESSEPSSADAGLSVSWDEVYRRAVKAERFLETYPDSEKINEVKQMYSWYVSDYIYGLDNTPAFEFESNALKSELKQSYLELAAKDSSKLGQKVKDYLVVLEKNNYKLTDEVQKYRTNLVNSLSK